jgi:hypothetical protein
MLIVSQRQATREQRRGTAHAAYNPRMGPLKLSCIFYLAAIQCAACDCAFKSAKEAWESTPVVFIGHIDRLENETHPGKKWGFTHDATASFTTQKAWLRVDEPLKGTTDGAVFVTSERLGECAIQFKGDAGKLLVYAYPTKDSNAVYIACTRTRSLKYAGDDLLFLRSLPASTQRNRVSGTVSRVRSMGRGMFDNVEPLGGIRIVVGNDSAKLEATTDANGVFELVDLRPGLYQARVIVPNDDLLYMSYIVGKAAVGLPDAPFGKPPSPFLVDAETGVEVDFVLASSELLQKSKSKKHGNTP